MKLDKQEYKELQEALLSAFPDKNKLEQIVFFTLDKNLDEITGGKTLEDIIFELIKVTQSEGKLDTLITGVYQKNPGNPELKAFYEKYKRQSSLIKILDNFKLQFRKEYNEAYQKCLSHNEFKINLSPKLDESVEKSIKNLDKYKDDKNDHFSLLDCFVGYLKLNLENQSSNFAQKLDAWFPYDYNDLRVVLEQKQKEIEQNTINTKPCLLIAIFEKTAEWKVQAWIINDIQQYNVNQRNNCELLQEEKSLKLKNFPKVFRKIYEDSLIFCKNKKLNFIEKIKVFLPYKLIECSNIPPLDTLIIKEKYSKSITVKDVIIKMLKSLFRHFSKSSVSHSDAYNYIIPDTFGKQYELTLEFSERLRIDHHFSKWEKKRKIFDEFNQESCPIEKILPLRKMEKQNLKDLYIELDQEILGIRFINKIKIETAMQMLYHAGIPFALWVRQDISELNTEEELDNICKKGCLERLSSTIKHKRYEAWRENKHNHIGNHLSLLCDTANLLPPSHLLSI